MSEISNQAMLALVRKYNRPGPRYTSYPMAPEWRDDYGPDDYKTAVTAAAQDADEPISLYLHIPFCRKLCWFCGCNKVISSDAAKAQVYLDRVSAEVEQIADLLGTRRKVSQVHWGGGTPSILSHAHTQRSFQIIADHFDIQSGAEVAMEVDPRTTSHEKIDLLKSLGFNRISLGVQDLDADVQRAINRDQAEETTVDVYRYCRRQGFTGINFDLIYGLPRQQPQQFSGTIAKVIELRPDRVALYSFAHIPELLPSQKLFDPETIPDPGVKLELFRQAQGLFLEAGYVQIGMDHFVLPEDELARALDQGKLRRNFMGYTVKAAQDWVGLGMSAISYIHHNFAQNQGKLKGYQARIDEGRLPTHRGMALSRDDRIRQHVIAELMCNFQLDLQAVDHDFGIECDDYFAEEWPRLDPFIADELLIREDRWIRVTELGKNFIRNIAMNFDAYLHAKDRSKPDHKFSKTI